MHLILHTLRSFYAFYINPLHVVHILANVSVPRVHNFIAWLSIHQWQGMSLPTGYCQCGLRSLRFLLKLNIFMNIYAMCPTRRFERDNSTTFELERDSGPVIFSALKMCFCALGSRLEAGFPQPSAQLRASASKKQCWLVYKVNWTICKAKWSCLWTRVGLDIAGRKPCTLLWHARCLPGWCCHFLSLCPLCWTHRPL